MFLIVYFFGAYIVAPAGWKVYERRHPPVDGIPRVARTKSGVPADPVNIALVGSKADVERIMKAANWKPADPLSLRNDLRIAEAAVIDRPYEDAPVSTLYLFGHAEELAFEQAVGKSPRKRHHVRFWQSPFFDSHQRPIWAGAAVFDDRVGLSRRTGQITHHTAANVDAERDKLFRDLMHTGLLADYFIIPGFHRQTSGHNGGGDLWYTDGSLFMGIIANP